MSINFSLPPIVGQTISVVRSGLDSAEQAIRYYGNLIPATRFPSTQTFRDLVGLRADSDFPARLRAKLLAYQAALRADCGKCESSTVSAMEEVEKQVAEFRGSIARMPGLLQSLKSFLSGPFKQVGAILEAADKRLRQQRAKTSANYKASLESSRALSGSYRALTPAYKLILTMLEKASSAAVEESGEMAEQFQALEQASAGLAAYLSGPAMQACGGEAVGSQIANQGREIGNRLFTEFMLKSDQKEMSDELGSALDALQSRISALTRETAGQTPVVIRGLQKEHFGLMNRIEQDFPEIVHAKLREAVETLGALKGRVQTALDEHAAGCRVILGLESDLTRMMDGWKADMEEFRSKYLEEEMETLRSAWEEAVGASPSGGGGEKGSAGLAGGESREASRGGVRAFILSAAADMAVGANEAEAMIANFKAIMEKRIQREEEIFASLEASLKGLLRGAVSEAGARYAGLADIQRRFRYFMYDFQRGIASKIDQSEFDQRISRKLGKSEAGVALSVKSIGTAHLRPTSVSPVPPGPPARPARSSFPQSMRSAGSLGSASSSAHEQSERSERSSSDARAGLPGQLPGDSPSSSRNEASGRPRSSQISRASRTQRTPRRPAAGPMLGPAELLSEEPPRTRAIVSVTYRTETPYYDVQRRPVSASALSSASVPSPVFPVSRNKPRRPQSSAAGAGGSRAGRPPRVPGPAAAGAAAPEAGAWAGADGSGESGSGILEYAGSPVDGPLVSRPPAPCLPQIPQAPGSCKTPNSPLSADQEGTVTGAFSSVSLVENGAEAGNEVGSGPRSGRGSARARADGFGGYDALGALGGVDTLDALDIRDAPGYPNDPNGSVGVGDAGSSHDMHALRPLFEALKPQALDFGVPGLAPGRAIEFIESTRKRAQGLPGAARPLTSEALGRLDPSSGLPASREPPGTTSGSVTGATLGGAEEGGSVREPAGGSSRASTLNSAHAPPPPTQPGPRRIVSRVGRNVQGTAGSAVSAVAGEPTVSDGGQAGAPAGEIANLPKEPLATGAPGASSASNPLASPAGPSRLGLGGLVLKDSLHEGYETLSDAAYEQIAPGKSELSSGRRAASASAALRDRARVSPALSSKPPLRPASRASALRPGSPVASPRSGEAGPGSRLSGRRTETIAELIARDSKLQYYLGRTTHDPAGIYLQQGDLPNLVPLPAAAESVRPRPRSAGQAGALASRAGNSRDGGAVVRDSRIPGLAVSDANRIGLSWMSATRNPRAMSALSRPRLSTTAGIYLLASRRNGFRRPSALDVESMLKVWDQDVDLGGPDPTDGHEASQG